ncbi:MAG: peptidase M24, partial [Proteobacteria bacterium]
MNTANPSEIESKLATVRRVLKNHNLAGLRLRGTDWFAWATGGGSNVVLLTTDTGVAEVLITLDDAFIITDNIEAERLQLEELSSDYKLWQMPWYTPEKKEG